MLTTVGAVASILGVVCEVRGMGVDDSRSGCFYRGWD